MSIRIQEQVLFEIAMSLGKNLDLDTMLSSAMGTYLRRLCCMGTAIFLKENEDAPYSIEFSIPRKAHNSTVAAVLLDRINNSVTDHEIRNFNQELPLHLTQQDNHYYLMELPKAGFIMIEKGITPMSRSMLKSLHQINTKLAESIITCQTHHKNEILNMRLKNQIKGRKHAEETLLEERKKYQIIFENSPIGIVYYDQKGVIKDCNQKYIEIMGSSKEKLIGFNSALYSSEGVRQKLSEALRGIPVKFEGEYTSATGNRTAHIRSNFNPVMLGSEETEVIVTVEEITPSGQ